MALSINSKSINDLESEVSILAEQLIQKCNAIGIQILITSTYRNFTAQNALYAQGRTKPGKVVTKAKAGQSYHNWRIAFDVVPIRGGKPVWGTSGEDGKLWQTIGKIGTELGLEWAGNWKTFKEFPHFQKLPTGVTNWRQLLARFPNGLPEKREFFENDEDVMLEEIPE